LELHFFAPNQSQGAFACETNDKPLNGSRVSAVPGWWAAQRQFMTSLKSLLSKHPAADYYMVVDDDTMVLRHNLQTLITSLERDVLDPNEHLYMGHAVLHPELQIPYVMSGGGVLLRGGTLRLLDQQGLLDSYALRATRDLCWHHFAWQLGGALAEIGVKALGHPGFQQSMQDCTTCCHSGSVACHPFKDRALQETLLATYAKQEGILKPMKLSKHLAEACGKNYSWHEQRSECGASSNYLNLFEDSSQTKDNLCIEGRIVPELLLLGAQKAATTTLAKELMSIPGIIGRVLAAEDRFFEWKEAHIYDSLAKWQNKDSWKQGYVTCTDETRIVSIDATPDYLHSTAAPQRILENYGDRAQHVKFIVLLREPLARTQSAFYHLREKAAAWGVKNSQIFKASFQQYIQQRLANNLTAMDQDPVNVSLYPRQLANYFDVFSSQQFSIAPFRSVLEDSSLANHIAKRLGLPQMLQLGKPPQVNAHQHPTFEGDLEPSVLSRCAHTLKKPQEHGKLPKFSSESPVAMRSSSDSKERGPLPAPCLNGLLLLGDGSE